MESLLTIVCYKDGEIIDGPNGVCYSCPPKKGVLVNNLIKYDELEDKLCHVMSIDRTHIANDDQQGQKTNRGRGHGRGRGRRHGHGAHGGLHVSPIEPLVEHAHHRRPLRKRKAPSCGTH